MSEISDNDNPEMITIRVYARTNKVGSDDDTEFEVEREVWESMTDAEKDEAAREYLGNLIEWGYEVKK